MCPNEQNAEKWKGKQKTNRKMFETEFLAPPTVYTSFIGSLYKKAPHIKLRLGK